MGARIDGFPATCPRLDPFRCSQNCAQRRKTGECDHAGQYLPGLDIATAPESIRETVYIAVPITESPRVLNQGLWPSLIVAERERLETHREENKDRNIAAARR